MLLKPIKNHIKIALLKFHHHNNLQDERKICKRNKENKNKEAKNQLI